MARIRARRSASHQPSPLSSLPSLSSEPDGSPSSALSLLAAEDGEETKPSSSETAHLPTPTRSLSTGDDQSCASSTTTSITVTRVSLHVDTKTVVKTESTPPPVLESPSAQDASSAKRRGRPPKGESLLRKAQEEALRVADRARASASVAPDADEDEDSEEEEQPRRSLRTGRDRPPKFYDDTKRRAPRKKRDGLPAEDEAVVVEETVEEEVVVEAQVTRRRGGRRKKAEVEAAREPSPPAPALEVEEEDAGLPKCRTCFVVVPVIKVDGQIVWDGAQEDGDIECPR